MKKDMGPSVEFLTEILHIIMIVFQKYGIKCIYLDIRNHPQKKKNTKIMTQNLGLNRKHHVEKAVYNK